MAYVDGFLIPVPKKNIKAYQKIAKAAGKVWMDHGALQYYECVGDDLDTEMCTPFTKGIKTKPGETVIFAFITYKSRAHRDKVNSKVMKDKRLDKMASTKMPFDVKRMMYGGFKSLVAITP